MKQIEYDLSHKQPLDSMLSLKKKVYENDDFIELNGIFNVKL